MTSCPSPWRARSVGAELASAFAARHCSQYRRVESPFLATLYLFIVLLEVVLAKMDTTQATNFVSSFVLLCHFKFSLFHYYFSADLRV
jgi:hypothetical protein